MNSEQSPRNPTLHPVFRDLVNNLSRSLPAYADRVVDAVNSNASTCEDCGTSIINDCPVCGAPQCCPKCCKETTAQMDEEAKKEATLSRPDRWDGQSEI